ncbi:LON peptidase substrate-binding domain-containing protein [Hyphobacterium sp. HN65]|uniref:LON peptidase substrate-binding domain-containing protein n=1 Tax=Hyphobacterium lacteum TaxID=3116575 RepID=A0ABU7LS65_9PROT|nr:LON peptidase substrate-binding domain-containing protein [Hyphobacterium sp. HN65]MEE2526486.1 LON peptidase substrate-binding domain-containing protein [Hyphobacterium sp. HN65]
MATLPDILPLFPLGGAILLPGEVLPLNVFEPRYLNMTDDAMAGHKMIGIVQTRAGGAVDKPDIEAVGGAGVIIQHSETDDGRYLIVLQGVSRFEIRQELDEKTPYRTARVDWSIFDADRRAPEALINADRERFSALLRGWFANEGIQCDWSSVDAAPIVRVVDQIAMNAPFAAKEKQALLEAEDVRMRYDLMTALLEKKLAEGAGGTPN